jgi:glycosyltransferase involved in cell wall biosynthesis
MVPQRILMTTDAVGGVWAYSLRLAEALARSEVRIDLATMGPLPSAAQDQDAVALSNVALHKSTYRLEWMSDPWEDVARAGEWLVELERQLKPDIVHLNGYTHGALSWAAPICMVAHSCVLSWWEAVYQQTAPSCWSRYRAAVSRGIRNADRIIAPTSAMLESLRKNYGSLPNSTVIYNGTSATVFRPSQKLPMVLTAGRLWDSGKNIEAVIRAAAELAWEFVVAGEGQPDSVSPKNVSFAGWVPSEKIREWMATASIYCLPARYEPFGLSVLEAGLSGCALVLGDIPSLRELWNDSAIFVEPDDHKRLAQMLGNLMEDEQYRKQLAESSTLRAREFTVERMAESYLETYKHLLETRRVPVRRSNFCL